MYLSDMNTNHKYSLQSQLYESTALLHFGTLHPGIATFAFLHDATPAHLYFFLVH